MKYQVTMNKTIQLSVIVESDSAESAAIVGRDQLMYEDETAFIEESSYSPVEVYELEEVR